MVKQLKQYQGTARPRLSEMKRQLSQDEIPILGMPTDPAAVVDEAIKEISEEVEARRRQGSQAKMPEGQELVSELRQRVKEKTGLEL